MSSLGRGPGQRRSPWLARNHPVSKAPDKPVPASQAESSVGPLNSFRGAAHLSPGSWAPICTPVCLRCMLVSSRLPPHTTNSRFWPGLKRSSREAGPPGTHDPCWSPGSGLSGTHGLPSLKLCRAAREVALWPWPPQAETGSQVPLAGQVLGFGECWCGRPSPDFIPRFLISSELRWDPGVFDVCACVYVSGKRVQLCGWVDLDGEEPGCSTAPGHVVADP